MLTYWERKQKLPHGALSQVARDLGLTITHVSQVNSGARRSRAVEAALAEAMGLPVDQVFPPASSPRAEAVA